MQFLADLLSIRFSKRAGSVYYEHFVTELRLHDWLNDLGEEVSTSESQQWSGLSSRTTKRAAAFECFEQFKQRLEHASRLALTSAS